MGTHTDACGDDWLVFAADNSHFDSRWTGVSKPIFNHPNLSAPTKRKILHDNARRLYPLI
jgi:predicted TIM-barrel fold metal-dependent hydrolase